MTLHVLTCSYCAFLFHISQCSGVNEGIRGAFKKNWKRETRQGIGGKTVAPVQGQVRDPKIIVKLVELDKKLNLLVDLPSKVNGIEQSIRMLSDQFDEIKRRIDRHEKDINSVKRRMEKMEGARAPQDLFFSKLQDGIDGLEWHSRRLNLEIYEVPQTEGENLLSQVNEIAQQLNIDCLSEQDVVVIHRLPARPGRTRSIIVRNAWLAKKRSLRDSSMEAFIAENMTTRYRKLQGRYFVAMTLM